MKKNLPAVIKNQKVQKKKKRTPFFSKGNSKKWQSHIRNSIEKEQKMNKIKKFLVGTGITVGTLSAVIAAVIAILGYTADGAKEYTNMKRDIRQNKEMTVEISGNIKELLKISKNQTKLITKNNKITSEKINSLEKTFIKKVAAIEVNQGKIESKTELLYEDFKNRKVK